MNKMNVHTKQMREWESDFGNKYTERNPATPEELDELFLRDIGKTRSALYTDFLSGLSINNVLEVGSNRAVQLLTLNNLGFHNLYGVEINQSAIDIAKQTTKGHDISVIKGSALDIPFKDSFFDLVFTSTVLIHISPDDINFVIDEIYRCSKRYILGYEYYANAYTKVNYRGKDNLLWKTDFAKLFLERHKDLKIIRQENIHI
jgi:pseudaminic acid biosynthesis-associated methylase